MEILALALVALIGLILVIRNRSDSNNGTTPTPTPTPSATPSFDKNFTAFSLARRVSPTPVDTKIQFMADGSVVSDSYINGERVENSAGTWNVEDFTSGTPTFEVSNKGGESFSGPDNGTMDESPEWVMSLPPRVGLRGASFILTVTDGNVTKKFKVSLLIEASDLRL